MTKTPIATAKTYDDADLLGYPISHQPKFYDVEIYENYAILTHRTAYVGCITDTVYKAIPPGEVFIAARKEAEGNVDEHEPDLVSALFNWFESTTVLNWQMIRRGRRVPIQ